MRAKEVIAEELLFEDTKTHKNDINFPSTSNKYQIYENITIFCEANKKLFFHPLCDTRSDNVDQKYEQKALIHLSPHRLPRLDPCIESFSSGEWTMASFSSTAITLAVS